MSWNPLQKLFSHEDRSMLIEQIPTTPETKQVEELIKRYNKFSDISRNLHKEAKLLTDCVHELSKCENKLTKDLSRSTICHHNEEFRTLMEEYHSVVAQSQEPCDELILVLKTTLIEPLKRYRQMFTQIDATLRKRDLAFQEYYKNFAKLGKLKTKEATGKNVANKAMCDKTVKTARKEIAIFDQQLLEAFPHAFKARLDYFHPCIEALVKAKITYFGQYSQLVKDLVQSPLATTVMSDDKFNSVIHQKMAEIKKLNIVVPD